MLKTFRLCAALCLLAAPSIAAEPGPVLQTYADIALAAYGDSLTTAQALASAVDALLAAPGDETLAAARAAYIAARVPYQQTEAYRFGNPVVDDWEGRVNAWPLDEGLIDYVDASYGTESDTNGLYTANVIANASITVDGTAMDLSALTPEALRGLNEAGGIEANVTIGYHAIEFLLWGQDLNGTGPGAGNRTASDFSTTACTGGHCDRRGQYLKSAVTLLVADLEEMVANWQPGGKARAQLPELGLSAILTGMGSLSYGELAGQRMKLGLILHDPEEEHECFSDTTTAAYLNDVIGIRNVYLGRYTRTDGSVVSGPSLSALVAEKDSALDTELRGLLDASVSQFEALGQRGEAFDQMIGEGNAAGNAAVQSAIDALIAQTRGIERAMAVLGVYGKVEGSDSLDDPDAVFQ